MTLRHDLAQYAADVASNPKTAPIVSAAAISSGAVTYLEMISKWTGVAASAAGFILAVMLIRKAMLENRKLKIEIDNLRGNKDG